MVLADDNFATIVAVRLFLIAWHTNSVNNRLLFSGGDLYLNPVLQFVHRLLRREGPYIITRSSLFGTWFHQILGRWFVFLWRQCLGCLTHLYLWVCTISYFLFTNYCDNELCNCCMPHFYHVIKLFFPCVYVDMLGHRQITCLHANPFYSSVSFLVVDFSAFLYGCKLCLPLFIIAL